MLLSIDHLVLTVASITRTERFYRDVLGCRIETFGEGRKALHFGAHKINLHQQGKEFEPKAARPIPGSADLCFSVPDLEKALSHVEAAGVEILEGPVARTGAQGPINSIYLRDPDGNLLELSQYV